MIEQSHQPGVVKNQTVAKENFRGCEWVLRDRGDDLLLTMVRIGTSVGKPQLIQYELAKDKLSAAGILTSSLSETLSKIHNYGVHRFAAGITKGGDASNILTKSKLPALGKFRVALGNVKHTLGTHGVEALTAKIKIETAALESVKEKASQLSPQPVDSPKEVVEKAAVPSVLTSTLRERVIASLKTVSDTIASGLSVMPISVRRFAAGISVLLVAAALAAPPKKSFANVPTEPKPEPVPTFKGGSEEIAATTFLSKDISVLALNKSTVDESAKLPAPSRLQLASLDPKPESSVATMAPVLTPPAVTNSWEYRGNIQGEVGASTEGNFTYGGHWNLDLDRTFGVSADKFLGVTSAGSFISQNVTEHNERFSQLICGCHEVRDSKLQVAEASHNDTIGNFDLGLTIGKKLNNKTRVFLEGGGIGRSDHQGLELEWAAGAGIQYQSKSAEGREVEFDLRGMYGEKHLYGEARLDLDLTKNGSFGVGAEGTVTVDHQFEDPNVATSLYARLRLWEAASKKSRLDLVGGVGYAVGGGEISVPSAALDPAPSGHGWRVKSQSHRTDEDNMRAFVGLRFKF